MPKKKKAAAGARRAAEPSRHPVMLKLADKRRLDRLVKEYGGSRNERIGQLLAWFEAQPDAVRLWALGMMKVADARRALLETAAEGLQPDGPIE